MNPMLWPPAVSLALLALAFVAFYAVRHPAVGTRSFRVAVGLFFAGLVLLLGHWIMELAPDARSIRDDSRTSTVLAAAWFGAQYLLIPVTWGFLLNAPASVRYLVPDPGDGVTLEECVRELLDQMIETRQATFPWRVFIHYRFADARLERARARCAEICSSQQPVLHTWSLTTKGVEELKKVAADLAGVEAGPIA